MKIETVAVGLVSLVVAILVIVTVAVPVVEDSQNGSSYSGENSGAVQCRDTASTRARSLSPSRGREP